MTDKEEWRDVDGFKGHYMVSNLGRVKSLERKASCHKVYTRTVKGMILKPIIKTTGYAQYTLSKNGESRAYLAHRIVADAFLPADPTRKHINHKDGVKHNNHVSNLERCTVQENTLHGYRVLGHQVWQKGKYGKGVTTAKAVLQLTLDGELVKRWDCASDAVRQGGFDSGCISRVAHGQSPFHKGFRWQYV